MDKTIDLLNRQDYVNKILNLLDVATETNRGISIALKGRWGSGKSFLLNMLEEHLKGKYIVIRYDAWDKDFYDEPLIGILYSFAIQLNKMLADENLMEGVMQGIVLETLSVLSDVIGGITNKCIGINVPSALKKIYKQIKKARKSKEIQVAFNNNLGVEEAKVEVRKTLEKLSKQKPILFLVDEIDRCLPDYSLKVLERLHHFVFGIDGINTLTAFDKEKVGSFIKQKYGESVDIDSYFRKFFDNELLLNEGNFNDSFNQRYNDYVTLFSDVNSSFTKTNFGAFLKDLFSSCEVRLVDKTVEKAMQLHKLLKRSPLDLSEMYIELLFSLLSLYGNKRFVFDNYFPKHIINPQINQPSSTPEKKDLLLLNSQIDNIYGCYSNALLHGTFRIFNFYEFLWYLIVKIGHVQTSKTYEFVVGNNISTQLLNAIEEYIKAFSKEAFII